MSGSAAPSPFEPADYDAIEATMAGSERGRWFLAEYARRNRTADTDVLLAAIGRLEDSVATSRTASGVEGLRGDLMEMADAIARTKAEIAAISAPEHDQSRLARASEALDAIVRTTERATSDILGAAEAVQEVAWTMRERGLDDAVCDSLDRHATQIYTACSFQDLTAQRTGRIVHILRYLEDRLHAMIAIWGDPAEAIPPAPGEAVPAAARAADLDQSDVDRFIAMDAAAVPFGATRRAAVSLDDEIVFVPVEVTEDLAEEPWAEEAPIAPEAEALDPADMLAMADAFDPAEPAAADLEPATELEEPAAPPTAAPPPAALAAAREPEDFDLADLDTMSVEDKLALFS